MLPPPCFTGVYFFFTLSDIQCCFYNNIFSKGLQRYILCKMYLLEWIPKLLLWFHQKCVLLLQGFWAILAICGCFIFYFRNIASPLSRRKQEVIVTHTTQMKQKFLLFCFSIAVDVSAVCLTNFCLFFHLFERNVQFF